MEQKIGKLCISLQTPVLLYKSGVQGGIHVHGHVFLMCVKVLSSSPRESFIDVSPLSSRKHVRVMYTPLKPTFIQQNWDMQGYTYVSYFCFKT